MPQNARREASKPSTSQPVTAGSANKIGQTENERIAAMFQQGADQWAQEQQEMAKFVPPQYGSREYKLTLYSATPVFNGGPRRGGKLGAAPDHPPPVGYICYRCGEKGHWIQSCPTNTDPTFDGRPRVKRTTGIPKSFLKTVEKPKDQVNDGTIDDTKQPSGVMVTADGDWVVAEPDKATWDRFQAKAQVSAAAQRAAAEGSKELQERGLECPIDKRLFVDPTKTPCCHKTFCHECISNALVENDLKCPECATEDVPIDNLPADTEMAEKVKAYKDELAAQEKFDETKDESSATSDVKAEPGSPNNVNARKSPSPLTSDTVSKKRRASSDLTNDHVPSGPAAMSRTSSDEKGSQRPTSSGSDKKAGNVSSAAASAAPAAAGLPFPFPMNGMMPNGFNPMAFPNANTFMGMQQMSNMNNMAMNFPMGNPMMMGMPNFNPDNMWNNGFNPQGMGMGMNGGMNGGMMNNGMHGNQQNMYNPQMNSVGMTQYGNNGMQRNAQPPSFFSNQQRSANDEDSPYFRKPVNPHRHQGRRNINRPADYREI